MKSFNYLKTVDVLKFKTTPANDLEVWAQPSVWLVCVFAINDGADMGGGFLATSEIPSEFSRNSL